MTVSVDNVYAVILAAGASSRLGRPKQLLPWRGRTLLEHTFENARRLLLDRVVVVLGADAESVRASTDLTEARIIVNSEWQSGMASSIRAGVKALPDSARALLLLLCDQPLLESVHLEKLLVTWQQEPNRPVACRYNDSIGVPALLPSDFFEALSKLEGDRGAKRLLTECGNKVRSIPMPEAGIDIDTACDYAECFRRLADEK
ncbi:MAG: nucleotidyltransferase family protein [Gammaproteobacteria bacterium]